MVFEVEILDDREGSLTFRYSGPPVKFEGEAGEHSWQRVPPTERRGRVQTSTVTVAVLPEPRSLDVRLEERDLTWKTCRGSGPGGQHRNKTESAVQLSHAPSGLVVRVESERSQHQNREAALAVLRARLWAAASTRADAERSQARRDQISGGQKLRTVRYKDGIVVDHRTGRRYSLRDYLRGAW